jgi:RHS repeat-associated protein
MLGVQSYGPFGEARDPVGTPPWGFTGEWQDPAGMVYLRARRYDPTLGWFHQVDPVAGELVAPTTQHPYVYVLNRPLIFRDPMGLRIPDEDAGTGVNPYQGSPLTSAQIEWAKLLAHKYEIPFEFLAGVLHTQRVHDYGFLDRLEDEVLRSALLYNELLALRPHSVIISPEEYLHPQFGANLILTLASLANLTLGLGQIRISRAEEMEQGTASSGLLCASVPPGCHRQSRERLW